MNTMVRSGANTHLLGYVRSFRHRRGSGLRDAYLMKRLPEDSGEYLSALHGLRSLRLRSIIIEPVSQGDFHNCFSAFRETLAVLALEHFSMSFSTFMTLVGYFPNITTLKLAVFTVRPDEGPVPPLSRPLRGKICLGYTRASCVEFFIDLSSWT